MGYWVAGAAFLATSSGLACERAESNGRSRTARLDGLGYLGSKPVSDAEFDKNRGVTFCSEKVHPSLLVYCSHSNPVVNVIHPDGRQLHRIETKPLDCYAVEPFDKESFLVLSFQGVAQVGWDGDVRWRQQAEQGAYHHHVSRIGGGEVVIIRDYHRTVVVNGEELVVLDDAIVVLTPGTTGERVVVGSLFDLLRDSLDVPRIKREIEWKRGEPADLLHTNYVQPLGDGTVVVSVRNPSLLVAINLGGELLWTWGSGILERQHDPVPGPDGTLIVFNNRPSQRRSQVISLDIADRTRWTGAAFSDRAGAPVFSGERGHAQPLPNGNMLITESNDGRLLEFDPDGLVVWEYWNPETSGPLADLLPNNKHRRLIQRATKWWPTEHTPRRFDVLYDEAFVGGTRRCP